MAEITYELETYYKEDDGYVDQTIIFKKINQDHVQTRDRKRRWGRMIRGLGEVLKQLIESTHQLETDGDDEIRFSNN